MGTTRLRYDIWGPDVLAANLMESSGVAGRINVSEKTAEVLREALPSLGLEPHLTVPVSATMLWGHGSGPVGPNACGACCWSMDVGR